MIIFNSQNDWVSAMKKAVTYNTVYKAQYPYNLLYWTGSVLYGDCVNFQKALFNGRNVFSMAAGSYQGDLNNTGDCDEIGLLNQCSEVSGDFSRLKANEPRILYMSGHIGAYIGEEVTLGGKVYNVIEWTAWAGDFSAGCIYSYVDGSGRRLNHKGGSQCMSWEKHGKPTKWVQYIYKDKPEWVQKWHLFSGQKMFTGWQEVDGKWYYLAKDTGIMATGWIYDKEYNGWFLLDPEKGHMLTGWQKTKGEWYYLAKETTNSTVCGKMQTGWLKDDGKWYFLDTQDGHMYTGTHVIGGKTYKFDDKGALIE